MEHEIADLERVAQLFRREIWESATEDAVDEQGIEVCRFGPVQATAVAGMPQLPGMNLIQGAAEPGAVAGGWLAEAIDWMRAREVEYRVPVSSGRPGTEEAEEWLGGHGFESGAGWVKLVRDCAPARREPAGIAIWTLGECEAEGEGISSIVTEALDLCEPAGALVFNLPMRPGWHCYTAATSPREGIVSTGSMLIAGDVAQLGIDATLPHARGRGCGRALLHRRLHDAAEAGCRWVFAELGGCDPRSMATVRHSLLRAGFVEACRSQDWQRPALKPSAAAR